MNALMHSPVLHEADLLDDAGDIRPYLFFAITAYRTRREYNAYRRANTPRSWDELWSEEYARTAQIVRTMRELRADREAVAALPAAEQISRNLELRMIKLRDGLGDAR